MGHYYDRDGNPCHTQPTKKGAKNATRPTTVADAKKQGLLPSVTTIFDVISKPFLEEWKIKEALKVAYDCPPIGAEDKDQWIATVKEKASQQVGDAADLGTAVHAAIESALHGREWDRASFDRYVSPVLSVIRQMNIGEMATESVTVNPEIGYAGCVDLSGWMLDPEGMGEIPTIPVVIDFKTKKTEEGKKIVPSETYPWQLAAYHVSKFGKGQRELHPLAKACNIYISSTEPGRVEVVWYDCAELNEAWECFKACHKLWCLRNGYNLT